MNFLEEVSLEIDEFEAIRLRYHEGLYQDHAAGKMKISRQTFGRILESANKKIAEALINGKAIKIDKYPEFLNIKEHESSYSNEK